MKYLGNLFQLTLVVGLEHIEFTASFGLYVWFRWNERFSNQRVKMIQSGFVLLSRNSNVQVNYNYRSPLKTKIVTMLHQSFFVKNDNRKDEIRCDTVIENLRDDTTVVGRMLCKSSLYANDVVQI